MKKNLSFKFIFTVIILIYLISQNAFSQVLSELDFVKLDSLLFQKKYTQVQNLFIEKERIIYDFSIITSDTAEFYFIRDRYLKLADYFQKLVNYNEDDFDARIKQFKNYKKSFNTEMVGLISTNYYNRFLDNSTKGKKLIALKNYNLAFFYKTLYLKRKNKKINKTINQIEQNIKDKKFDNANTLLRNLELESGLHLKKEPIHTKFKYLKEEINDELTNIKIEQKLYHQEYETNHSFVFSLGAQFVPFSSIIQEDQTWYFKSNTRNYIYDYKIDRIELNTSYSFLMDIGYYSKSNLKHVLTFEYGTNNSYSINKVFDYSSSFDIEYFTFQIGTDYLFRNKIGLRPYIGLGLKKMYGTREQVVNDNDFITLYNLVSEQQKFTLTQILLNFGTEYIYSKDNDVVMQLFTSIYYNLNKSKLIGAFGVNFGVKIGYAI